MVISAVLVRPDSGLVDVKRSSVLLAVRVTSVPHMPRASIFVVGVVVGVGKQMLDLTALVMQEEFGKGIVESIAIKLTYSSETVIQLVCYSHQ
jgi:hypothetical protein